ncbi:MAG TPA: nucleotidyltransferase family protein [Thermoguttaceae bacterium]|nr:nucleotidyltransferase family protein [Thermoguttaceae bacterium]
MESYTQILSLLREAMPYLRTEYGVKRLALFGSYAQAAPTEKSDVNLVVKLERPIGLKFMELAEYLEHLLGRKVDLLTLDGLAGIRIPAVAQKIKASLVYV